MKFDAKDEKKSKAVNRKTWYFLRLTAKLSNNWINELY